MVKNYYIYILASQKNGTLYIGITNDLVKRCQEHIDGVYDGFTKKYGVKRLVYYEDYPSVAEAIAREKQLKEWNRQWKIDLIEQDNPEWFDLYKQMNG